VLAVAQARNELGDDQRAIDALVEAKRITPEWVRYHRLATELTQDLTTRVPPHRNPALSELVQHLQLAS